MVVSISVAVAAIIKLPLATISAAVAKAALKAVIYLAAGNAENNARLGSVGCCEGGWLDGGVAG